MTEITNTYFQVESIESGQMERMELMYMINKYDVCVQWLDHMIL